MKGRAGWRALWGNKGVNFERLSPEEAPLLPRGVELRKAERDRPHHGNGGGRETEPKSPLASPFCGCFQGNVA